MIAAKNGYIAEFVTGYLQREIRYECKVSGGTDLGLRDGALGIAVQRLVKLNTATNTLSPAANLAEATHIVAQSDDTVRDLPRDYNYTERYTQCPNLVVKNSNEVKTVALFKIVNKDDIKLIKVGEDSYAVTAKYSGGTVVPGANTYLLTRTGYGRYKVNGTVEYDTNQVGGNPAGNIFYVEIINPDITSADDLPTGDIVTTKTAVRTATYDKTAFENDFTGGAKLIYAGDVTNTSVDKVEIDIEFKEGVITHYEFDLNDITRGANA